MMAQYYCERRLRKNYWKSDYVHSHNHTQNGWGWKGPLDFIWSKPLLKWSSPIAHVGCGVVSKATSTALLSSTQPDKISQEDIRLVKHDFYLVNPCWLLLVIFFSSSDQRWHPQRVVLFHQFFRDGSEAHWHCFLGPCSSMLIISLHSLFYVNLSRLKIVLRMIYSINLGIYELTPVQLIACIFFTAKHESKLDFLKRLNQSLSSVTLLVLKNSNRVLYISQMWHTHHNRKPRWKVKLLFQLSGKESWRRVGWTLSGLLKTLSQDLS